MAIDTFAMEPQFVSSGSSSSINNTLADDHTQPLISTEVAELDSSKKRVYFSKSSRSSSKGSQDLLRKTSKSKKDTYPDCQRKELLMLVKNNNTQDIMSALHPDVNVADEEDRTLLILAIQNHNDVIINELCMQKNIDVNQADKWGNTPLHHAVLQKNAKLITILLNDHRVNSLLKNQNNFFAHQFLYEDCFKNFFELRATFFRRSRLELIIDQKIPDLQKKLKGSTHRDWNNIISEIKKSITNDGSMQAAYEPLPTTVQLPFNDTFIRQMILYRLVKQGVTILNYSEIL